MDGVKTFEEQYFARFSPPKQCDTKSPSGQCPDQAYYVVHREDRPEVSVCLRCVTAALFYGTNRGKVVTVHRVVNR